MIYTTMVKTFRNILAMKTTSETRLSVTLNLSLVKKLYCLLFDYNSYNLYHKT